MTNAPDDWVSWFVAGRAVHFRADSPRGREIVVALAHLEHPSRICQAPKGGGICGRPFAGRKGQKWCSDLCALRARRSAKPASETSENARRHRPTREPISTDIGTRETPGHSVAAAPVIADTADISDTPARPCANCGVDITGKRKGAVVCGDSCRKAITRRARQIAGQAELTDLLGQPVVDVDTGGLL